MYCSKAFTKLVIGSHICCTCSPAWIDIKTDEMDPWKAWNHPSFQLLRKRTLERRAHCKSLCPAKKCQLDMNQEEWHKPIMKCGPKEMVFVANRSSDRSRIIRFLEAFRTDVRRLVFSYGDDPLTNPVFGFLLQNLQGIRFPQAKIRLYTDGVWLGKRWNRLSRIHDNIDTISFNLNTTNKKTYQATKGLGSWKKLHKSLALVRKLDKDLTFHFLVCHSNMEEMIPFIKLAQDHGAKKIKFAPIAKGDVDESVFKQENVANRKHPDHARLVELAREIDENYIRNP